jgi:hypothetical protein
VGVANQIHIDPNISVQGKLKKESASAMFIRNKWGVSTQP